MRRFLSLMVLLIAAADVRAVVIAGGTGGEQTSDPGGGLPFGNVGRVNGASGVYLGDFGGSYWVLTASHVVASGASLGNFTLNGQSYAAVNGSGVVIRNGDNSPTDLSLFRIASDPGVNRLTLATSAPVFGSTVWMVGYGLRETGALLYWNVTGSGSGTIWDPLPDSAGANVAGYATANGGVERFGGSKIVDPSSQGLTSDYDVGTGVTEAIMTEFIASSGYAQAAVGDSGGALFFDTGTGWELAGILGAVGIFDNQPGGRTVFGQTTYAGDVAFYEASIASIIGYTAPSPGPEPAADAAWLAGAGGVIVLMQRNRRARASV